MEDAERYKAEDEDLRKKVTAKNDLENLAYQMRNTLTDEKFADKFEAADKEKVEAAVKSTIEWVENNQHAELDELEAKKKELEEMWRPIITKVYGAAGGGEGMPGGGMPGGMPGMPGGMPGGFPGAGGMPGMGSFGGAPAGAGPDAAPTIDEVD